MTDDRPEDGDRPGADQRPADQGSVPASGWRILCPRCFNKQPLGCERCGGFGFLRGRTDTGGILTVGDLRAALDGIPDHTHVCIPTADWWVNVAAIVLPDEDDGHFTFDLVPGDDFDTRQF